MEILLKLTQNYDMVTFMKAVNFFKLFPAAIGSQRNITLTSYKKRFQEETAVEKYVQNA